MSEVTKLYEEFNRKVEELQETCPHEEVTDWYNPHWAPGHPTLYEQRTCKRCGKVIEKRYLKEVTERVDRLFKPKQTPHFKHRKRSI